MLEKIGKYTKQRSRSAGARAGARRALLPARPLPLRRRATSRTRSSSSAAVPEKSEFYPKAKFFEGLTHVREYQGKTAADAFKAISAQGQAVRRSGQGAEGAQGGRGAGQPVARPRVLLDPAVRPGRSSTSRSCPARCARGRVAGLARVAVRGVVGVLHDRRRLQGARQHPLDHVAVLRERVLPRGATSSRPSSTSTAATTTARRKRSTSSTPSIPTSAKKSTASSRSIPTTRSSTTTS